MDNSFYSEKELSKLGLKKYGNNVLISKFARIYKPEVISLGSNVRIDDFCILSGGSGSIKIGNSVHISCFSALFGSGKIIIGDYVCVSVRCTIFSEVDDPSGKAMIGSIIPAEYRKITRKKTILYKYSALAPHSILLPGANLYEGAMVYSNSFVIKPQEAWTICGGNPTKYIKKRSKNIIMIEKKLTNTLSRYAKL